MGEPVRGLQDRSPQNLASAASRELSTPTHASYLSTRTFGSLDGLRALSILGVVWHHTQEGLHSWPIAYRGFLGVDLFFVISGFLIVTLLLRERRRTGTTSLKKFYIRRFLRIFPPYYGVLALVAIIAFLKPGEQANLIRRDLPYALFYISNLVPMVSILNPTWSLAVEEQFYLVVPTLQKFGRRMFPAMILGAYVLVSLPPFGFLPNWKLPDFFRETTFGPILLGVTLALLLDHPTGYLWTSRVLGSWLAPAIAGALVLLACNQPGDDISGFPRVIIHCSLLAFLATCVMRERHVLAPILRLWPIRRIGAVSYGIYLYHLMARHAVKAGMKFARIDSQVLFFLATAACAWAVAEVSYRFYESRFLALKSRWE
jgi:peptidoglycan/LPS O-acetylase OafA/YrhL